MPQSVLSRFGLRLRAATVLVSTAACVALWVSSFWTAGSVVCNVRGFAFWATSERNLIELQFNRYREGDEPSGGGLYPNPDYRKQSGLWDELRPLRNPPSGTIVNGRSFNRTVHEHVFPAVGLGYRRTEYLNDRVFYSVYVPYWLASLSFALLPTVWYLRVVRPGRRRGRGCCVRCGYDLRATPTRCPECGTAAGASLADQPPGHNQPLQWTGPASSVLLE